MGLASEWSHGSLRLTVGRENTETDIDKVVELLPDVIEKLRGLGR
jgi:cysteine desulfurase